MRGFIISQKFFLKFRIILISDSLWKSYNFTFLETTLSLEILGELLIEIK